MNSKPQIKYSKRKTLAIKVDSQGNVVVNAPKNTCVANIDKYLIKHQNWIIKQKEKVKENKRKLYELDYDPENVDEYKKLALTTFSQKADYWANKMNIKYNKVSISNAKKR